MASVVQDDLLQGWAAEGPWIADLSIYPAVTNRIGTSRHAAWEVATLDGIVQDAPSISETTSKWLATQTTSPTGDQFMAADYHA